MKWDKSLRIQEHNVLIINAKQDGSKIIIKAKLINPQAYETDKELGTTKTKQNKTIKQKKKFLLWLNLSMFVTSLPQVTSITKKLD